MAPARGKWDVEGARPGAGAVGMSMGALQRAQPVTGHVRHNRKVTGPW